MEAKAAKIGMVILIATVIFRFAITDEQKAELYSIFSSVDRNVNDFNFDKVNTNSLAIKATSTFKNDYSNIRTKAEARIVQETLLAQLEEPEDVPSDYVRSDEFEMFTHLNNVDYSELEEEAEPLESYNTINASMSMFFPPAK